MESKFAKNEKVDKVLRSVEKWLSLLSDSVLCDQPAIRRKKIESLVSYFLSIKFISNLSTKPIHTDNRICAQKGYLSRACQK